MRNTSLTTFGLSAFGVVDSFSKSIVFSNDFKVNEQRIVSRIAELAKFGRDANGHGYRVAYTKGDIEGREWFMELMKNAGLEPTIEAGGNIIGNG